MRTYVLYARLVSAVLVCVLADFVSVVRLFPSLGISCDVYLHYQRWKSGSSWGTAGLGSILGGGDEGAEGRLYSIVQPASISDSRPPDSCP